MVDSVKALYNGGVCQGFVQWMTLSRLCTMVDCQGFVQLLTLSRLCTVVDSVKALYNG